MAVSNVDNLSEIWKPIVGNADYEVSNIGRVRRVTESFVITPQGLRLPRGLAGRIMKPLAPRKAHGPQYVRVSLNWKGYLRNDRTISVHRLVAEAFIDNPENKPVVNHLNGNKSDNRVENLEWCTHQENCMHSYLNGMTRYPTTQVGENHTRAKLNNTAIRQIRQLSSEGVSNTQLANLFGVDQSSISRVINGMQWKHVT